MEVEDDHKPFVKRGVPSIDLVDLNYGPNNSWHHTAQDTIDKVSAKSLTADGDVILETIRLQPAKGSLLPVILAVEVTDLIFAVDSIPAVLAVTRSPFVAYTSNVAAVLGLRALYFALAALLDRFRYLHLGLGLLLGFVALKMLAAHWMEVPITLSLAIMGAIIGVCALVSVLRPAPAESAHR